MNTISIRWQFDYKYGLLIAVSLILLVSAATIMTGELSISGGVIPWGDADTHLKVVNSTGLVGSATGDFAFLAGGFLNTAGLKNDLPLQEGTGDAGTVLFDDFKSFHPDVINHSLSFTIKKILTITRDSTNVLVDMILTASSTLSGYRLGFSLGSI